MQTTTTPGGTTRTVISPYPRADAEPLRTLTLTPQTRPEITDRRSHWVPYLTGGAQPQAPLATRFVTVLAGDEPIDDPQIAWPATLYPAGFRRQVLSHCATSDDLLGRILPRPHLQARIDTLDDERSGRQRLRLALTLNSLSLYRQTVMVLGQYARSTHDDPHLTYEVARAAYQIGRAARALEVFGALTGASTPSLPIRLNAASRLVAHYARSGHDLEACGRWVEASHALLAEESAPRPTDFATGLAVSRVHRAIALYASRRRDPVQVTAALQAAHQVQTATEHLVHADPDRGCGSARERLRRLELAQNERLILEAALKAYVATAGRVDPLGATTSADRLGVIDPWDPYTQLTIGDARWMLEDDERALESYAVAVRMGTLAGALAAHRGAVVLAYTGRRAEAETWRARAVALDPAAAAVELPGE